MQIITIMIGEGDGGRPALQSVQSDGITPELAAEVCQRVADLYRDAAIEAEIQRRVEAAQSGDDRETEPVEDDE
jgi:hypothetical protein